MRFVVEGRPKPKERPRFNRRTGRTYTPKATLDYEEQVAWACRAAMNQAGEGPVPAGTPVVVEVHVYPDRLEVEVEALDGLGLSKLRGDADNYAKSALDGINGVAFDDDVQVSRLVVVKH